jgi:aminoglycoside phosphotransferase (APT) family kinase protein
LASWLAAKQPGRRLERLELRRPQPGLSSDTLLAELSWSADPPQSLVLRLAPAGPGLFPDHGLARQFRLQAALRQAGMPVAAPLALEEDPAWLGSPFMLMEKVAGRTLDTNPSFLTAGWLHDSPPSEQRRLHQGFLEALAELHRLDWQGLDLGFAARPGGPGLASELAWWADYLAWASEGHSAPAALVEGLEWCRSHLPADPPPDSLLWGDVQLANAVFGPDLSPVAILDWEMACIGPAEVDLGWFLALHRASAEACGADLPGFLDRPAALALYQRRLGRPLADLGWFEAFGALRAAAILVRMAGLLSRHHPGAAALARDNPPLALLSRLMG